MRPSESQVRSIGQTAGPAGEVAVTITTRLLPASLPAIPRVMGVTITTKTPEVRRRFG